jgi:hypothetical protein
MIQHREIYDPHQHTNYLLQQVILGVGLEGFLNLAQWAGLLRLQPPDQPDCRHYGRNLFAQIQCNMDFTYPALYCLGLGELTLIDYAGNKGWFFPVRDASSSNTARSTFYPDPYCVQLAKISSRDQERLLRKIGATNNLWIRYTIRSILDNS